MLVQPSDSASGRLPSNGGTFPSGSFYGNKSPETDMRSVSSFYDDEDLQTTPNGSDVLTQDDVTQVRFWINIWQDLIKIKNGSISQLSETVNNL